MWSALKPMYQHDIFMQYYCSEWSAQSPGLKLTETTLASEPDFTNALVAKWAEIPRF